MVVPGVIKSLGLRRQPMKLVLLNLVPPVPYTWRTSSSSISTMSHLITIIRIRVTKYVDSPPRHHEPLPLVEPEVHGARHVGDVTAQVQEVRP